MVNNKKKILFFLPPSVGGAERVTITISRMLPIHDYSIEYYIVGKEKGQIESFIHDSSLIHHIKISSIWDFTTTKIYCVLKKEKPYAVFCSLVYLNIRVILASHLMGNIKTIVRNDNMIISYGKLNELLVKYVYRFANIIVLQQEEMKNEFVNRFGLKDKCIVLHNPLDTITINKSLNAPSPYDNYKGTKFVYTARFTYNKGQDILIKAFAILRRSIPNAHLYLVGKYSDDVFFRNLKQLINENGLIESVHLVGYDQNPYRWVKYSDCFVLPSRLEGLPNSLIEAMYIGVPVVATRSIPIIDRIVQEGYNGYVVDSEDFRALADRMKDALELKNFSMTYKPASENDVVKLFSICRK